MRAVTRWSHTSGLPTHRPGPSSFDRGAGGGDSLRTGDPAPPVVVPPWRAHRNVKPRAKGSFPDPAGDFPDTPI